MYYQLHNWKKATVISTVVYIGKVELGVLCILCAVRGCARQVTFMDFHGINTGACVQQVLDDGAMNYGPLVQRYRDKSALNDR